MSKSTKVLKSSVVTSNRGYPPMVISGQPMSVEHKKDRAVLTAHLKRPGLGGKRVGN